MRSGTGKASSPDMRAPTLHVRLFGGLDLRLGDAPVPPLDSARAESLLAYLLLHPGAPQPRERLAFLLWPDSSESQARTNLRHVLHKLRRALPDADRFIEVRPRTLQWRTDAPVWLDVAVFEEAVAEGRLEEAVETYTGDLLEGSYEDWLLEERERLAHLHIDVLERLVRQLEEQRRWPEANRYAEQLLRRDPLREQTYRLLMRLYDASGDRARALRIYHVCQATLQRELDVEPSAATREAYEALLPISPEPRAQEHGPTSPVRPPLVGRASERARLAAVWARAVRGSAQLVLVTGEPGIGKTRLMEELRSWCAHKGAVTAEARAYPAEGAMAYGLVATWLRSDAIAGRLDLLEPPQLTELARVLPELLAKVPDLRAPEPLRESEQRQRLFRAMARAIVAARTPVLLVADDLQWSDVETLQFVHYLLRAEPEARLLVAATARREEIDSRHPINDLVAALQALERISEIELERLGREETGLLAERMAGRPLADAENEQLYAESEGNPLFVIEALHADAETTPALGPRLGSRVQAVVASRLALLSDPAAELVGIAATIGREFTTVVLADASGADDGALVRGLDELWRRGLVRAHGPTAYDFSHGKIREAAYRALSPALARHYHLRVAHALERTHAGNPDMASGEIAAHYDRAGAPREATAWYRRAAEAAQRLHASAKAVQFLERALELVRDLPPSTDRAALELRVLTALPAPLGAVEGYLSERVTHVHERALRLLAALGVEPEAPLVRSLALATLARGDFDAARPFGEQLRARAEREGDDVLWVESTYVLGVAAFWQGRLEVARAQFEAAVERCRPEHRGDHLLRYGQDPEVFCGMRLAYTLWFLGRDAEARRPLEAALGLAEQIGHPFTQVSTMAWSALLALDQHDEERLLRHLHALAPGADAQSKPTRLFVQTLSGYGDVLEGRYQEGITRVRRSLDEAREGEP
ncbi:MAG: AAA family ATPase, partial [Actinomycetota bacterium]|nr:AAA family ATPase [Actinomycetota bacterium]